MRDLTSRKSLGNANSLWYWSKARNPLKVAFNFLVIYTAKFLPSLRLKNLCYRLVGAKIGKNVSVGLDVTLDIFYPELIEIEDNCIIGFNSVILTHEFLIDEWRTGRVKIGKNVVIGANCTILPGISIGNDSIVSAMSLVNKDVPPKTFAGGIPVKVIKKLRK